MNKGKMIPVGKLVDIRRGASPRPIDEWMADKGVPWVKISDATREDSRYIKKTEGYIKPDGIKKSVSVKPGDLIISNSATPGLPRIMKINACIHDGWLLVDNYNGVTQDYLFYQILNMRKYLVNQGNGSIFTNLKTDILKEFPIFIPVTKDGDPDIQLQEKIANVLKNVDEKIENNAKISAELEGLAKTIYDYWFVQFEFPNEEGKPYKSSGGKMVYNEELKREIPEGWRPRRLGDLISYNRGISYTGKDLSENGTPIISLASIDRSGRYIPDGIKYYNKDYPSSKVLKPFDLVMANTDMTQEREVMGKIIFVPDVFEGDVLSTHHITKVEISSQLKAYLMMTTQTEWFHNYIKGFSSGTNVLGMNMIGFDDYCVLCPTAEALRKFDKQIYSIYSKIFSNMKENQQLASLRDWLLPMLMNGQISFKE